MPRQKQLTPTRQTSLQLTEATERQVAELQALGFGSFTDIVRLAVDRMAREESARLLLNTPGATSPIREE